MELNKLDNETANYVIDLIDTLINTPILPSEPSSYLKKNQKSNNIRFIKPKINNNEESDDNILNINELHPSNIIDDDKILPMEYNKNNNLSKSFYPQIELNGKIAYANDDDNDDLYESELFDKQNKLTKNKTHSERKNQISYSTVNNNEYQFKYSTLNENLYESELSSKENKLIESKKKINSNKKKYRIKKPITLSDDNIINSSYQLIESYGDRNPDYNKNVDYDDKDPDYDDKKNKINTVKENYHHIKHIFVPKTKTLPLPKKKNNFKRKKIFYEPVISSDDKCDLNELSKLTERRRRITEDIAPTNDNIFENTVDIFKPNIELEQEHDENNRYNTVINIIDYLIIIIDFLNKVLYGVFYFIQENLFSKKIR
jgi:hypothetical protein